MSVLDIPPHPPRTTRLAMGVLALVAAAAFTEGFLKQVAVRQAPAAAPVAVSEIAEARPITPSLQVADTPHPRHAASPVKAAPHLDVPEPKPQAEAAPATDAAAIAPDSAAAPAPSAAPAGDAPPV